VAWRAPRRARSCRPTRFEARAGRPPVNFSRPAGVTLLRAPRCYLLHLPLVQHVFVLVVGYFWRAHSIRHRTEYRLGCNSHTANIHARSRPAVVTRTQTARTSTPAAPSWRHQP
jgi:hypothetical protein